MEAAKHFAQPSYNLINLVDQIISMGFDTDGSLHGEVSCQTD